MTTTHTIPWRVVSRHAGRNDLPTILVTYWHRLPAADKPVALDHTWHLTEYPEQHADQNVWLAMFDDVGYMVDGRVTDRATDPDLPEVVTLWRGAVPERRHGMSWSFDRDQALWFAGRWNGMDGTRDAHLYRIEIPNGYVLARVGGRSESEAVVDTTDFDDEEYILETS